jgi:cold shock CspA family protein
MKGKISQWKDDKGFGFIIAEESGDKVFFHISSLTTKERRPKIGDSVVFVSITDNQNRLKATSVAIEGLVKTSQFQKQSLRVEPKTKSVFDYLLVITLLASVAFTGLTYFKTGSLENSWMFGIPAIVTFLLLGRQKKPKSSSFQCSKCRKIELYDTRTIQAWNRGFTRLYCSSCHINWLKNNPRQEQVYPSNKGNGCLGMSLLIISITLSGGYSIINWFV